MTASTNYSQLKRLPRQTLKKQAGLSFLGVFALITMVLFIGLFAMKVVPGYVEFMTVSSIADDTQADPDIMKSPKSKVLAHINQAYRFKKDAGES